MKKLIMGALALILTISTFAQSGKVISAFNYFQEYTNEDNGKTKSDDQVKNLEEAVKNIDIAVADPSTSESSKAWWYRAKIYQTIGTESRLADKYPTASLEAVKSYQKLLALNDPKFKAGDWSDVYNYLQVLINNIFNEGVVAFQKKNYHSAYQLFYAVSDIDDILTAKGQKTDPKTLTSALGNAGLCAENDGNYKGAMDIYKKMLPTAPDAKLYISVVALSKKLNDTESAKKYTDEGLAKYPGEKELLIDKVNFFMADGKFSDAIDYLRKLADQDPKNEQVQAALGIAYDQLKDTVNARKVYENLVTLNPNSFEGNYGLGGLIFNKSKPIQEKMNALGASKEDIKKYDEMKIQRDAIFMQAKPYLEKANAARPDDPEIKKALNTIDAMTRK